VILQARRASSGQSIASDLADLQLKIYQHCQRSGVFPGGRNCTNLAAIARLARPGRGEQLLLDRIREFLRVLCLWLLCRSANGFIGSCAFGRHSGPLYRSPSRQRTRRRKPLLEDAAGRHQRSRHRRVSANWGWSLPTPPTMCVVASAPRHEMAVLSQLEYHEGGLLSSLSRTIAIPRALGTMGCANREPCGGTGDWGLTTLLYHDFQCLPRFRSLQVYFSFPSFSLSPSSTDLIQTDRSVVPPKDCPF
jgi:hypothetical protein